MQKFYYRAFQSVSELHRPCGYATITVNGRDMRKRTYRHKDYRTPYEKLKSLTNGEKCLKNGITAGMLQGQASAMSDTEAARCMQRIKLELLGRCRKP